MVDIKQPSSIQGIPSVLLKADTGSCYSVDDYVGRVIMSCEETEDAFIFLIIKNFINERYDMEVSKEELTAAIEL